jgi:hypothetical protein
MGLDLWFREDVVRILAATHETMRASTGAQPALDSELADAYQRGFVDALRAVGIAFGVAAPAASRRGGVAAQSPHRRLGSLSDWKER